MHVQRFADGAMLSSLEAAAEVEQAEQLIVAGAATEEIPVAGQIVGTALIIGGLGLLAYALLRDDHHAVVVAPLAPDVLALLQTFSEGDAEVAVASSGAGAAPVMPTNLTAEQEALWLECSQQHDAYKATQQSAASLASRMQPLLQLLLQNRATLQNRIDFCALLNARISLVQRLHSERSEYLDNGCDQFDWFNRGATRSQREADHRQELANVDAQLRNFYALRNRLCQM